MGGTYNTLYTNLYVDIITKVVVLGGEAFGRSFGHESGALMNGISAIIMPLIKTSKSFLTPSAISEHREKTVVYEPESRFSPDTKSTDSLVLHF